MSNWEACGLFYVPVLSCNLSGGTESNYHEASEYSVSGLRIEIGTSRTGTSANYSP